MKTVERVLLEGSFCGDYSLAIVNRSIAVALVQEGYDVYITSSNESFEKITADSEVIKAGLSEKVFSRSFDDNFDLHLFNDWPVHVDRKAPLVGAICWAWEETVVPFEIVDKFNRDFDFVAVASKFTEDALLVGGLTVPVFVVGEGVDHLGSYAELDRFDKKNKDKFIFLHVSSCFWRKGVDALLNAFNDEFAEDNGAELIIKTFRNPHNGWLDEFVDGLRPSVRSRITIIYDSLDSGDLARLYLSADCTVFPTRGEGFLLPAAESMLYGTPVIVTGFSGHMDYCNEGNSVLVDYALIPSISHVSFTGSMVAEPNVMSLRRGMRRIQKSSPIALEKLAAAGIEAAKSLTWRSTIAQLKNGLERSFGKKKKLKVERDISVVTTWGVECGIATYSQELLAASSIAGRIKNIFSEQVVSLDEKQSAPARLVVKEGAVEIIPVWYRHSRGIKALITSLLEHATDVVVLQHHFGFFSVADVNDISMALHYANKRLILEFHGIPSEVDLSLIESSYISLSVVHSKMDFGRLKMAGFKDVVRVPHGIAASAQGLVAKQSKSSGEIVISTFGFCLPHKNFEVILYLVSLLNAIGVACRAKMLISVKKEHSSYNYLLRLRAIIKALALEDKIQLDTRFNSLDRVMAELSDSDVAVFPYAEAPESASGAIRVAIRAGIPIICSTASMFDEFEGVIPRIDSQSIYTLASKVLDASSMGESSSQLKDAIKSFARANSFERIGSFYSNVVDAYC
ncbi:glycosyltransferase [Pseudomonas oryzihabitans]|uniref:glycosyltransferase family 4 protein n=1 Tax=Pseudomonas oryzihabitans TaxID=47885 RepID=UPI002B1E65A2|nr:glycosyltransferase [Pseudomonas oryzihabitans]